ncbi:MAG: hypothetical protein U9R44_03985 [Candidatus Omnitrophota bacterium]|nr:hypothetical protein [Candidatus Omnitrophota bacterium]
MGSKMPSITSVNFVTQGKFKDKLVIPGETAEQSRSGITEFFEYIPAFAGIKFAK